MILRVKEFFEIVDTLRLYQKHLEQARRPGGSDDSHHMLMPLYMARRDAQQQNFKL